MESEQTRRIASESTTHYREFLELSRRIDALESISAPPPAVEQASDDLVRRGDVVAACARWMDEVRNNLLCPTLSSRIASIPYAPAPSREQIVAETLERAAKIVETPSMDNVRADVAAAIRALSPASKPAPTFADGVAAARTAVEGVPTRSNQGDYIFGPTIKGDCITAIDAIKEPTT